MRRYDEEAYNEWLQQKKEDEIIFTPKVKYNVSLEQWYYKFHEIHYEEVQHILLASLLEELTRIRCKLQ